MRKGRQYGVLEDLSVGTSSFRLTSKVVVHWLELSDEETLRDHIHRA